MPLTPTQTISLIELPYPKHHPSLYATSIMLSLGRRRLPQRHSRGIRSLLGLPDDILILISSQCRIDELFTLRLVCAKTRNLIDEYITTIAPCVARSTLPLSDHLLTRSANAASTSTFPSLKALIPEQLASILVDRHRVADEWLQSRYGIPAEDPFGDTLRDRVVSGWRVLRDLSNISHQEHGTYAKCTRHSPADFANKVFRRSLFKLEASKQAEDTILQSRLDYIAQLEPRRVVDYKLMFTLLSRVFSTSFSNTGEHHVAWPFDFGGGIDGQRELRTGRTWLSWYILAEGPDLFWQQWWSLPHSDTSTKNYIRDRAIENFKSIPEALSDHQRTLARTLQVAVNQRTSLYSALDQADSIRHFSLYAAQRLQNRQAGLPPAKEILEHVPFLVNFRCPEEVVKRHEAVEEQRNIARASQPWPR
jgi:hypothetical protein